MTSSTAKIISVEGMAFFITTFDCLFAGLESRSMLATAIMFLGVALMPRTAHALQRAPAVRMMGESAQQSVSVRDGVFSAPACSALHAAACTRGLGHTLFRRGAPTSPLELAINSYLDELDDPEPLVEYWSRQRWMHLEAHADVDEGLAASTSSEQMRYPEHGHVLYLSVGSKVRGPTCVWRVGSGAGAGGFKFGGLTTVPAVAGRVLRFDGSLQHAVPKPHDVWLVPFAISSDIVQPTGKPADLLRSVILFNTWREPPQGVGAAGAEEAAPDGTAELVRCSPRAKWAEAPEHSPAVAQPSDTMKVWLLGDEARRGQRERTLPLPVDGMLAQRAMGESTRCTWFEEAARPPSAYTLAYWKANGFDRHGQPIEAHEGGGSSGAAGEETRAERRRREKAAKKAAKRARNS